MVRLETVDACADSTVGSWLAVVFWVLALLFSFFGCAGGCDDLLVAAPNVFWLYGVCLFAGRDLCVGPLREKISTVK